MFPLLYAPELNSMENDSGALKKVREYNNDKSIDEIIGSYN